jgi:hypothetical protein
MAVHFEVAVFGRFMSMTLSFLNSVGCTASAQIIKTALQEGLAIRLEQMAVAAGTKITAEMTRKALIELGIEEMLVNAAEAEFFGVIASGAQAGLEREAFLAAFSRGVVASGVRVVAAGARAPKNPYVMLAVMTGTAIFSMGCSAGAPPKSEQEVDNSMAAVIKRCYFWYRFGAFVTQWLNLKSPMRPMTRDEYRTEVFLPMLKAAKERWQAEKKAADAAARERAQRDYENHGVVGGRAY